MTAKDWLAQTLMLAANRLAWKNDGNDSPVEHSEFYADALLAASHSAPESVRPELAALLNPWRPIEEAPKDGTRILAYSLDEDDSLTPQITKWQKHEQRWVVSWDHDIIDPPPTHWLPLPAPPSEDK